MSREAREPIIRVRDLDVGYGKTQILYDVDMEIYPGELLVLLGGSGCGKSTLLFSMIGLLPPWSGTVELFGRDFYALSEAERNKMRRRFGMVFQAGALFGSMSIGENIALSLREYTDLPEEIIWRTVKMKLCLVGLEGMEGRKPSELSGGQQKRAAIARSLALDPEILFCDEPSSGLDPIVAAGVDDMLNSLQGLLDTTMVVVTHELASVRVIADRVVMMEGGRLVAAGTVEELESSSEESVRDFFAREPPRQEQKAASVLSRLECRDTSVEQGEES